MTRYIIQSKRTLLYVQGIDNGFLRMTSKQSEAFKYYYPELAKLEMYNNEVYPEAYDVIPFKGV